MRRRKFTVRLLRAAEEDLIDLTIYLAAENKRAAVLLADEIDKNLGHLGAHPFMGRIPHEEELLRLGYRFLVVQNYLVFYTVEPHSVIVHRILHGARDYLKLL